MLLSQGGNVEPFQRSLQLAAESRHTASAADGGTPIGGGGVRRASHVIERTLEMPTGIGTSVAQVFSRVGASAEIVGGAPLEVALHRVGSSGSGGRPVNAAADLADGLRRTASSDAQRLRVSVEAQHTANIEKQRRAETRRFLQTRPTDAAVPRTRRILQKQQAELEHLQQEEHLLEQLQLEAATSSLTAVRVRFHIYNP